MSVLRLFTRFAIPHDSNEGCDPGCHTGVRRERETTVGGMGRSTWIEGPGRRRMRPAARSLRLSNATSSQSGWLPLYGLSQVFKVAEATEAACTTDIAIISSPAIGDAYRLGEGGRVSAFFASLRRYAEAPGTRLAVGLEGAEG